MVRILVCLLAGLVLVSCGVPVERGPAPIGTAAMPSRMQHVSEPTAVRLTATPGRAIVRVGFVRDGRLVTLVRDASSGPRLRTLIRELLAGPTAVEQANRITSALPQGLILTVADVRGSRVVLELSGETDGRSATENVLAVAQIVLSVTAVPTVHEVTFSRGGRPAEALLPDGTLTIQPLTEADYAPLRAR